MENKIDWDLISELEGAAIKVGYVPDADSSQSGVTIGTGFDLGSKDEDFMTSIGVSQNITDKLKPFFSLKGAEAAKVANKLQLDDSEVKELDQASKNYYANKIIEKYEHDSGKSFDDLSSEQQTVITSVGFQYGSFDRTPAFWAAVTNGDWEGVEKELRNFGDNYSKRRIKEADLLGKKKVEALFVKDKTDKLPSQDIEGVKKVLEEVKEEPEKEEPFKYNPIKNLWYQTDQGGELYLDKVFQTYQDMANKREPAPFGVAAISAISDIWIIPSIARLVSVPAFESPPEGYSLEMDNEYVEQTWKDNNISPEFYGEFAGVINRDHFDFTLQRVIQHQKNKELLATLGWKGTALEIGAFFTDPVSWLGYGAVAKLLKPTLLATRLTRTQKFIRSGLAYGATEGTLFTPVALDNPTYGISDVIIATALGGTLGGGLSVIFSKNLNTIAKAETLMDIEEQGLKVTKKGEKEFKKVKQPFNTKALQETEDIVEDISLVKNIGLIFGRLRDLPFLGLFPFNRSGALGTSKSELVRLFNFLGQEEPVGYVFKAGKRKGQIAPQDDTVELIRNSIIQGGHNIVYKEVLPALKAYLTESGHNFIGRFVALSAKKDFLKKVAETIRSGKPSGNAHIDKAATAYRDGFRFMVDQIKKSGIDGAENLKYFDQYLPRKISPERLGELINRIGFDGVVHLLEGAISRAQPALRTSITAKTGGKTIKVPSQEPLKAKLKDLNKKIKELNKKKPKATQKKALEKWNLRKENLVNQFNDLNESIKAGNVVETTIAANKVQVLAKAIIKAAQMSNRAGGFDIESLVKIKDPAKLKEYLDDVLQDIPAANREEIALALQDNISLITSGRLEKRIRLDELWEDTIDGVKVRLDDIFENDVDLLWHSYMNEMSGWIAIGRRLNIKNRNELLAYQRKLEKSIDDAYVDKEASSRYLTKNKYIAGEEKKTITSFFKNILGRSAEDDPTDMWSSSLRALRKYNFMRVLNQVGIAQLPEFGVVTAQQGFLTLVQEMPHFKRLLVKAQKGELDDTFFEDMATVLSTNGTEHISRGITNYEIEDMGATAVGKMHDAGRGKIWKYSNLGERATGHVSGLFFIDSLERRLAMRLFVNRMAKDLIDVAEGGKALHKLKGRLNRYRAIGFTDEELLAIGREFSSKNVTTQRTAFGRRVLHFNFSNWADQDLAYTFGRRVNRYVQRAVQYNYLGDTNRFFSDKALGKSLGQFRSFIMTAWSKQFLHNLALADMQTATTFLYTTMIGGLAYIGQTNMNAIGMDKVTKKKYFRKKFGNYKSGDYSKFAMASFQRSGWSSLIPPLSDFALSALSPDNRFNFRSSGLEMNLWTGNPTYDVLGGIGKTAHALLKTTRNDYRWSRTDMNRMMRLLPFQNMYGVNNILNFIRDNSGLPRKGSSSNL